MKLELDVYNAICETKTFRVNGIKATYRDFGEKYDASPDRAKPYVCGNMVFEPKAPAEEILDKYGISINEYDYICKQLRYYISFGICKMCG